MQSDSLVTALFTVGLGLFVFGAERFLEKLVIEPVQEQTRLRADIAFQMVFLAPLYTSGPPHPDNPMFAKLHQQAVDASALLRKQACQLRANALSIPWYRFWRMLRLVQGRADVLEASRYLIGLSNNILRDDLRGLEKNHEFAKDILSLLDMKEALN